MSLPPRDEFISSITRLAGSVYDFHQRFGQYPATPVPTCEQSLGVLRERLPFLVEEIGEFAQDLNKGHLENASQEIADVAFVAVGMLLALNGTGAEACHAVAHKNDGKTHQTHMIDASSGKLVRRS